MKRLGFRPKCQVKDAAWTNINITQGTYFRPLLGVEQTIFASNTGLIGKEVGPGNANTGVLLHSNFEDATLDANFAAGSTTASPNGTPVIQTKNGYNQLFISQPPVASIGYDATGGNIDPDVGGISYRWTPSFSGLPSIDDLLFVITGAPVGPAGDMLRLTWKSTGDLEIVWDSGPGSFTQNMGTLTAVADQEYFFEFYWDTTAGNFYFFVDGVLKGSQTFTTGASTTTLEFFVFDSIQDSGKDYWIDDVTTYDYVKETTGHAVPGRDETELSEDSGCISTIYSGLSGARQYFAQTSGLLHIYDGTATPVLYDGINFRQIGIDQPASIPTGVAGSGGNLNAQSSYVYAYSYRHSTTGAESTPRISDTIALGVGEDKVTLTLVAGDSTVADEIVIYRTQANGNILFEETAIAISSTSHESTISDDELSTREIELDNSRITQFSVNPTYPIVANNRVFVVTGTNEIRFSKIGQSGAMPESFEVKSFATTEGSFGGSDSIVGLGQIRDLPIVIKERSIGRLDESGLPDVGISSDLVGYIYREISNVVGGVAHGAGCQVYDEYVFLSKEGVFATNGASIRSVGDRIRNTIQALNFDPAKVYKVSAINDRRNERIYISAFESKGDTEPNIVLVGDYQRYPEFRWTVYTQGRHGIAKDQTTTSPSTHPGIQAGCFFERLDANGNSQIHFGTARGNGQWYQMNKGYEDQLEFGNANKYGIYFEIVGRAYAFNEPYIEKLFKDTEFFARGISKTYSLELCSIYDMSEVRTQFKSFDLPVFGSDWADNTAPIATDGLWADNTDPQTDDAVWAGETLKRLNYDPHKKGRFYQPVFQQIDKAAPIEIYGWTVSASFGRPR